MLHKELYEEVAHGRQPIEISGEVNHLSRVDEKFRKYVYNVHFINGEDWSTKNVSFLLSIPKNLNLTPGDQLTLREKVRIPENF